MDIEKNIEKDINNLECKINNKDKINKKNFIIRSILKLGLSIDYALPYILSVLIIFNTHSNKPFVIDEVKSKASIETIDTSRGEHIEIKSYTKKYDRELLEHSTKWFVNEEGLYERHVTTYNLKNNINLYNLESIFSYTKEELDNILTSKKSTITKYRLDEEDSVYNDDVIVVINHYESNTDYIYRSETDKENFYNTAVFIIMILLTGYNLSNLKYLITKDYIKDKINGYRIKYKKIDINELDNLRKILEIKKNNLNMINDNLEYKLRK